MAKLSTYGPGEGFGCATGRRCSAARFLLDTQG